MPHLLLLVDFPAVQVHIGQPHNDGGYLLPNCPHIGVTLGLPPVYGIWFLGQFLKRMARGLDFLDNRPVIFDQYAVDSPAYA